VVLGIRMPGLRYKNKRREPDSDPRDEELGRLSQRMEREIPEAGKERSRISRREVVLELAEGSRRTDRYGRTRSDPQSRGKHRSPSKNKGVRIYVTGQSDGGGVKGKWGILPRIRGKLDKWGRRREGKRAKNGERRRRVDGW